MSSVSSLGSGINGGLDVQSIVDNLMVVERLPVQRLQTQSQTYQSRISAYQTLNTKLLALKTSAESLLFHQDSVPLTIPPNFADRLTYSVFAQRKAISSNEDVMTATADKGIVTGSYDVTVSKLATFGSDASQGFAATTDAVVRPGTLHIQKGAGQAEDVVIDANNNTLQGIKDAINAKNAGFTASIMNDGSAVNPYRLVITSNDSGSANDLTITADWDPLQSGTELLFAETVAGADAALRVNGVDVTSSSNAVTNAIEGVTLNLKANSGSATIRIDRDADAIVASVKDFIAKYNDVVSYISGQSKYDAARKTAGILAGDFTMRDVQSKLSTAMSQSITSDGSTLAVLSEVGVKLMNDGSISLDETLFKKKLASDYDGTTRLFLADGLDAFGNPSSVVPMLQQQIRFLTDSVEGPIFKARDAQQSSIDKINKQIEEMNLRLESRRAMYVMQYTKANEALSQLAVLQSSLSNQMNVLKNV